MELFYVFSISTKLGTVSDGTPVRVLIVACTTADFKEDPALIVGFTARFLLADRVYDTNDIVDFAIANGIKPVIAPK